MNKNNFFKIKKYKKSVVISFSENNIKADDIYYDLNLLVDDINFDDNIWAIAFDFSNGLNIQNASDDKFISFTYHAKTTRHFDVLQLVL